MFTMEEIEKKSSVVENDTSELDQAKIAAMAIRFKQFSDRGLEAARKALLEQKENA